MPASPVVAPRNCGGAEQAVEHLLEHGHTRIAFAGCVLPRDQAIVPATAASHTMAGQREGNARNDSPELVTPLRFRGQPECWHNLQCRGSRCRRRHVVRQRCE